ncbi:MAG: leucine-rich repeat domain-containing protein [Bacteroidales bacterium]|nr:leucine-rich repeat domain-containing protein [Bacteroidales bacterium]
MKERIFTLLLAMIMLMPAMAQEVEDPGWSLNEETGELRIWKDFDNFTYNSKDAWLASKDLIKSVVIENGVTKIADYSFFNCEHITSVVILNSVTSIGSRAFCFCGSLTSVVIPNSVTRIGNSTFKNCIGLTSVEIPNSVTSIGQQAFYDCSGLTSVVIPNSVTTIASDAFESCSNLQTVYTDKEDPAILKSALETSTKTYTYIVPCDFSDELVAEYTSFRLTVKKEWHNFTDYVYNEDASLDADGTETAVCDRDGCEATDTRVAEGTKLLPTGVEDVEALHSHKARKVVVNGRLLIEKDGEIFDLTGRKM